MHNILIACHGAIAVDFRNDSHKLPKFLVFRESRSSGLNGRLGNEVRASASPEAHLAGVSFYFYNQWVDILKHPI
jgi:hypothetical protein